MKKINDVVMEKRACISWRIIKKSTLWNLHTFRNLNQVSKKFSKDSSCTNVKSSDGTLMEEVKPIVKKKCDFNIRDESMIEAL